jgi:hypothetical protein
LIGNDFKIEQYESPNELSIADLIMVLGGELEIYPALLMEQIGQEEEAKAIVRDYLKGLATYEQVREKVSEII